jgi:hypothetical protein
MPPAKSVVFAGVPTLCGDLRGVEALSEPMPPAKSVVFAGVPILRGLPATGQTLRRRSAGTRAPPVCWRGRAPGYGKESGQSAG